MKLNRRNVPTLFLLAALPIQVAPPDSARTRFQIAAGTGQFALVARGCAGDILYVEDVVAFREISLAADYRPHPHARLGLKSHFLSFDKHNDPRFITDPETQPQGFDSYGKTYDPVWLANPYFQYEDRNMAIGIGFFLLSGTLPELVEQDRPGASFYLRAGPPAALLPATPWSFGSASASTPTCCSTRQCAWAASMEPANAAWG